MAEAVTHPAKTCANEDLIVVLCADPDHAIRISYWLGEAGHESIHADHGHDAAHILRTRSVGAIITDRLLPPWPGLVAFPLLKKSRPGIAIIYVGDTEAYSTSLAYAAGATHVLSCPLRRQAVLDALSPELATA